MSMTSYDELLSWTHKLTKDINRCKYGRNRKSLLDGIDEQNRWSREIKQMEFKIKQILNRTNEADKKKCLSDAYETLKASVEKKLNCLQTMLQVSSLEENCSRLSRDIDVRSVSLVKSEDTHKNEESENLLGFISTNSQDCINGLKHNWDWVVQLVKCIDVHLKNSSDYQQFFHEIGESERSMLSDFDRFSKTFEIQTVVTNVDDNSEDAKNLAAELDSVHISLRQWEAKTNRLWETASRLVPVPLRTNGIKEPTPATSLCDYETKDISICSGEDILLLDNSKPDSWKVRNGKGEEANVPPVIVLIPGPFKDAIDAASKIRMQLLTAWTNALKRIGIHLICYMLTVFKPEYNTHEIGALTAMEDVDKDDLLRRLTHIEETLKTHWADQEGFLKLQERLLALRMVLEEIGDSDQKDEELYRSLILQVTTLGQTVDIYQDMFKDWETFKVSLESSRAPELMLIVDKWEQLQFVSREYFAKFWKAKLPLDDREISLLKKRNFTLDGIQFEDTIDARITSPPSDTATMTMQLGNHVISAAGDGGLNRAGVKIVRVVETEEKFGYDDDDLVFNDDRSKSVKASVMEQNWNHNDSSTKKTIDERRTETVRMMMFDNDDKVGKREDGWKDEGFDVNGTETTTSEIHLDDVRDGMKENEWKEGGFNDVIMETTTVKTIGNDVRDRKKENEWKEGGFNDVRTETTTVKTIGNEIRDKKKENEWKEGGFNDVRMETTTIKIIGNDVRDKKKENEWKEGGFNDVRTETTTVKTIGNDVRDKKKENEWKEGGFNDVRTETTAVKINGNDVKDRKRENEWKEGGFNETRTETTTKTILGKAEARKEDGWNEMTTKVTRKNLFGRVDEEKGMTEEGYDELRTLTDSTIYSSSRGTVVNNRLEGSGDSSGTAFKVASVVKPVKKLGLPSTQPSFSADEAGFEELKEITDVASGGGLYHNRLSSSEYEGTNFGMASETKTAETEQLSSAEMEEKKIFTIGCVVNPNDHTEISLQQAIGLGVIRPNDGVYVNSQSGEALPIATAMTDGLIKVMFCTTKRTPEKVSSIGIITVKTVRRMARPCVIVSVKDTLTGEVLGPEEACRREIFDEGSFVDRTTGKRMLISEATEKGLMVIEFCGDAPEPEVISKTYAVRAVVDRRLKKTITFHEAVRRGIIDKEAGAFRDTVTNEKMYVGDAIMRGFLKARLIEDAHGLNIDPENKMVVDKTQKIRQRLLNPLKVISAFKMAAKDGLKK